jgi:hypothetical protein
MLSTGLKQPAMLLGELGDIVGPAREMPDHPSVVHRVARRGALRMVSALEDLDRVVVPDL